MIRESPAEFIQGLGGGYIFILRVQFDNPSQHEIRLMRRFLLRRG
jgi:hypothetical protein